ncbi:MAG: glycosyltransferase [Chitinispirillaceae bacterium]|nr:glycosyltransferase [Chitinispirillaceae bacterium]
MSVTSQYDIVILGLTITSSWGNGHATTYRGLIRELASKGHRVLFLERDMPWYALHRDFNDSDYVKTLLYATVKELREQYASVIQKADLVIVGSYVPEGIEVGEWVIKTAEGITAFYDIDTPVTMTKIEKDECFYLKYELIQMYDMYLSFAGGAILEVLEKVYGSPMVRPLYCSVDTTRYENSTSELTYDLGYMGTHSCDRQEWLDALLIQPALCLPGGNFIVAGPQYPDCIEWPRNVKHVDHIPPPGHSKFYSSQRYTLNLTRSDMMKAGYAPSVRLFEAAACGTPVISDYWEGLDSFFELEKEILIASSSEEVLTILQEIPEGQRKSIGERARNRILMEHTAAHRAAQLELYYKEALQTRRQFFAVQEKNSCGM